MNLDDDCDDRCKTIMLRKELFQEQIGLEERKEHKDDDGNRSELQRWIDDDGTVERRPKFVSLRNNLECNYPANILRTAEI